MARIGDTPEQQRINDANESQRRRRVDDTKRLDQNRKSVAFTDVMQQQTQKKQSQKRNHQQASQKDARSEQDRPQERRLHKKAAVKDPRELARRAALARATKKSGTQVRNRDIDEAKSSELERSGELESSSETERDRVRADHDVDDRREAQHVDEQTTLNKVDPDQEEGGQFDEKQQKDGQSGQSEGQADGNAQAIAEASAAGGAAPTRIPDEIIQHIAKAIAVAAAKDGASEVMVQLKGAMFDGVTLKVAVRKGKVRCEFEGCDKTTRNLVESSKGQLMRALAKKGLELDILRAR